MKYYDRYIIVLTFLLLCITLYAVDKLHEKVDRLEVVTTANAQAVVDMAEPAVDAIIKNYIRENPLRRYEQFELPDIEINLGEIDYEKSVRNRQGTP